MRSAHSPERLEVELQSRLGPSLSRRGYRVVGHGTSGVTWRRDVSGKLIAGLVALGLLAIGGLASGDVASVVFGLLCGTAGGVLFHLRRPATIAIGLTRVAGGTCVAVGGGRDAVNAEEIVRAVVGPEPRVMHSSEAPGSLWSTPGN